MDKMKVMWIVTLCVIFIFIGSGVFAIKAIMSNDRPHRQRQIQMVKLLQPPPPPKVQERPPEPEIKEKQEIIQQEIEEVVQDENDDQSQDEPAAGNDLGVDADGTAGSDGFGLVGKKGGRSLIGGKIGGRDNNLMQKYAWFTNMLIDEIHQKVKEYLDRNGGIPDGNPKTIIRITLNEEGFISNYEISSESGNKKMDKAVKLALDEFKISQPPPDGMPKVLKLKIYSKG